MPSLSSVTLLSIIFTGLSVICAVISGIGIAGRLLKVARYARRQNATPYDGDDTLPPVSVIVYAHNNSEGLAVLIPQILAQDYPAPMQVIVVNDGSDAATDDLLTRMELEDTRLYHTFTPPEREDRARKKLAVSLGIKASRHEAMIHLTAESRLPGIFWLRRMAAPLAPASTAGIVIGATALSGDASTHLAHSHAIESAWWLGAAIGGHAYRADGANMGCRRSLFFDINGYLNSLNLADAGDDDVFVSDATESGYTSAVIISSDSVVGIDYPDGAERAVKRDRQRRRLSLKQCLMRQQHMQRFYTATAWAWITAAITAICLISVSEPVMSPLFLVIMTTNALTLLTAAATYMTGRYRAIKALRFSCK